MSHPSMPARRLVPRGCLALAALLLLLSGGGAPARAAEPGDRTETWYEETRDGSKTGYRRVVWAPSTWEGRKTIHDTTTVVSATQRDMAGMKDRFEQTQTYDLERGPDGTLWYQRARVEEAGRVIIEELRWTGKGYVNTSHIEGQAKRTIEIPLDEPVFVDAESFLGPRARAGTLEKGQRFSLRQLDVRGRRARDEELLLLERESVEDENGAALECYKVRQRDPASGSEVLLWLDPRGVFVQVRMGATLIRRTTQAKAEAMPARPAEFGITVPATPRLERVFNADRMDIDIHVRGDEHRKLPQFPDSPWSRVREVSGDNESGWVVRAELRRHDDPAAKATRPIEDPRFERYLEATALMQTEHPLLKKTVEEVVGEERDARKAAFLLARFVFTRLDKQSPQVGQGDAVQILTECKGDCSEHGLVFVALCRAAGIPARLCSGYVSIGGVWGAHSWAEIWTGVWIGADPTTGEVGTAARYLFFGYPDEPGSFPGVVSSRASGRLRILSTRLDEGGASFDLTDESRHRRYDHEGRRYLHVLAGLEARDVPADWTVDLSHHGTMSLRGPGFSAQLRAQADQGHSIESLEGRVPGTRTTFAGAPAMVREAGSMRIYWVFSRRRIVNVTVGGGGEEERATLERVLAPTFAEPALAWEDAAPAPEEASGDPEKKPAPQPVPAGK